MGGFRLVAPASEDGVLAELASGAPGTVALLAGGTDLLLDVDEGRADPRTVVSLRRLPWATHAWGPDDLTIGSTEPLRRLEQDPRLGDRLPALAEAIAAVGSPALRRQATVGGNLGRAAPSSDLAPALLALDAEVELLGPEGRRTVPLAGFLRSSRRTALGATELIRAVRLPESRPASAYLWQRVRPANDVSQIGVAVAYSTRRDRWRIALGGVPPRAVDAPEAEAPLRGPRPAEAAVRAAAERLGAHPALVGDRRATGEHRRRLATVLCARAVTAAVTSAGGRR